MVDHLLNGIDGYELFNGSYTKALVELMEEQYEEFDHSGRLLPFELKLSNGINSEYPYLFIRRYQAQSPSRCRIINPEPISTPDKKISKFLIDINTQDGELLIGMIIARKKSDWELG